MPGLGAERNAQFILRGCDAERADHHRGERIGELALEHRAFARHHAVVLAHLGMQKRRKHVGQMNLLRVAEVAARQIEILRHHAQREILRAQNAAHLPEHFLHAHVGAGVARSVVAGEQQLQLRSRFPWLARAKHPFEFVQFDQTADPGFEDEIHHGRTSSTTRAAPATDSDGQSRYL